VFCTSAGAQDYPNRPVRMLVGFAPGGGTDVVARILAPRLVAAWGQQIVIDNRTGATGTIAAGMVARAAPDGYTLLMGHASTNTVAPALYHTLPYDPYRDFAPVTLAGSVPHLVSVHPSVPVKTVKELIALARANPGQLTTPSSGHGSMSHAEINRAQDLPEVKAQMDQLGTDGARTASPEAFATMFKSEYARYAKLVKEAGIKIE
jgi:tripartite-type tricarboxylate transporter receptor subunit TctC